MKRNKQKKKSHGFITNNNKVAQKVAEKSTKNTKNKPNKGGNLGEREICYCQALIHDLLSNCLGCGRIVCVAEGEGDCLFCGEFVESHLLPPEEGKVDATYKEALERRNKLLEYDKSSVMNSAIKDQGADWYELENNVWQSKEERDFAKHIREFEEKRNQEEADAVYVSIGGGKDVMSMSRGVVKSKEEMSREANQYINELAFDNIQNNIAEDETDYIKENLKDIRIQSCEFLDQKSRELMRKLKEDAARAEEELIEQAMKNDAISEEKKTGIQASLSDRLQTESPFDDFQRELERILQQKAEENEGEGEGDADMKNNSPAEK